MKVDKKANFLIFLIIAILALGLSNFAAAFTGDLVMGSFPGINETDKMIALDDDNFSPASVNAVYEPKKVVEEVNETDNSTDNSTDHIDDDTDDKPNDNSDNQNSNSDSNNNENSGDDSDSKPKPKPTPSEDSSDDE
ncbi:hypothetical protein [Methanobrevibacter sp.]|uniref:hypothetical protein n=1 Tax=Methanobrevibacter sp. TaxID=66852 RepID=UPI003891103D